LRCKDKDFPYIFQEKKGFFYVAHGATISNTMLKHLGVCRAAGGEKPPKSEGGGSERQRAGMDYRKRFHEFLGENGTW
jgi:hypothetical protein